MLQIGNILIIGKEALCGIKYAHTMSWPTVHPSQNGIQPHRVNTLMHAVHRCVIILRTCYIIIAISICFSNWGYLCTHIVACTYRLTMMALLHTLIAIGVMRPLGLMLGIMPA